MRDPVLRTASVYKYERKLSGETEAQRVALSSTFAEYVRWRLRADVQPVVRDFQSIYLSGEQLRYEDPRNVRMDDNAFRRALALLDEAPVFGVVERFADSVRHFTTALQPLFPEIRWRESQENATGGHLGSREAIRDELGAEIFAALEEANGYDTLLWKRANELLTSRI